MHTPGPWLVDADKRSVMVIARDGGMALVVSDLARKPQPIDHANAALIAAAPKLLAACHQALSVLLHMRYLDGVSVEQKQIEAAIAEAEVK